VTPAWQHLAMRDCRASAMKAAAAHLIATFSHSRAQNRCYDYSPVPQYRLGGRLLDGAPHGPSVSWRKQVPQCRCPLRKTGQTCG
jgi:hypothetical protein